MRKNVPNTRRFLVTSLRCCVINNVRRFQTGPQSKTLTHFPIVCFSADAAMTCRYCGTRNDETERRCARCGRRPGDTLTAASAAPVVTGATALRLQPVAQLHIQNEQE